MMNKILGSFALLFTLLIPSLVWSAVDIVVSTDRNPVHVDESFQLVFEANGSVDEDPDFSPLKVLLDVIRQSESSNISIINGSMSRRKTWSLTVMPKQVGDVQIPSIHFGDDRSPPLLIKVNGADQTQTVNSSFFVTLESDIQSSVEQAQILMTIRVFSDKSLSEISLSSLQFNHGDVVVETLGDEKSYQTKIQGKAYLVIEQKAALFPQKSGPLVVQPILALAEVRSNSRTFFGDPATKSVRARSGSLSINVTEKPSSNTTWLPAKSLTLTDQWLSDPSQFTVGEPITRVLTLAAEGLTAAQFPELDIQNIESVKMYPDQDVLKNNVTGLGVSGIRQEKIAYIPSQAGVITLPAISIPWWNTETKQWQKAEIAEQIITVKANEAMVEQAPIVQQTPINTQEIEHNTLPPEIVALALPNVKKQPLWQWAALFFALAWLITLYFYINKRTSKAGEKRAIKKEAITFDIKTLKSACQNKDSQACKSAVIQWANAQFQPNTFTQIADLKAYIDADFYQRLGQLELVLYSSSSQDNWNPDDIYNAVLQCSKNKIQERSKNEKNLKSFHLS